MISRLNDEKSKDVVALHTNCLPSCKLIQLNYNWAITPYNTIIVIILVTSKIIQQLFFFLNNF